MDELEDPELEVMVQLVPSRLFVVLDTCGQALPFVLQLHLSAVPNPIAELFRDLGPACVIFLHAFNERRILLLVPARPALDNKWYDPSRQLWATTRCNSLEACLSVKCSWQVACLLLDLAGVRFPR